jgi:hypothetical protein
MPGNRWSGPFRSTPKPKPKTATKNKELEDTVVYYTKGKHVYAYYNINGTLIPYSSETYVEADIKHDAKFSSMEEARYSTLLLALKSGKPIQNFKSSKYYKYYIKRLKEDNPEYLV